MEERVQQLEREKEAQMAVAAKIRAMESKLLSGDGNLFDQTREQQKLLDQRRWQLAEQKVSGKDNIFILLWKYFCPLPDLRKPLSFET